MQLWACLLSTVYVLFGHVCADSMMVHVWSCLSLQPGKPITQPIAVYESMALKSGCAFNTLFSGPSRPPQRRWHAIM
jgi:hypothetical protein